MPESKERYEETARILREWMRDLGIRQSELARKLHVDQPTVWRWYHGQSWPGDRAVRQTMRDKYGDDIVDAIETEMAKVHGLDPAVQQAKDTAYLQVIREHPEIRKQIEAILAQEMEAWLSDGKPLKKKRKR